MSTHVNFAHANRSTLPAKAQLRALTLTVLLFVLVFCAHAVAEDSAPRTSDQVVGVFFPTMELLQPRSTLTVEIDTARSVDKELFVPIERNLERNPDLQLFLGGEVTSQSFSSGYVDNAVSLPSAVLPTLLLVQPTTAKPARRDEQPTAWLVGFWSIQAAMWGAVVLDGVVSGDGAVNCAEDNARFRGPNGEFQRGKYFALNLPVSAAVTLSGRWLSQKARHSRYPSLLRALSVAPASAMGGGHTYAAMGWINHCH